MIRLADEAATLAFGRALAALVRPGDVIALSGDLGTGKTTLARGLLAALGLAEEAPSPSFAIVQLYDVPEVRIPVAHVDLYRLDDPEDAQELGLDDMRQDSVLVIEWPERLGDALWPDALRLGLQPTADGARALTATVPPSWEGRWPPK